MKTTQLIGPSKARHGLCACNVCGNELPIEASGAQETELKCSWCSVELLVEIDCGYSVVLTKNPGSANEKRAIAKFHLFEIADAMNEEIAAAKAEKNIKICLDGPELAAAQYWKVVKLESELRMAKRLQSLRDNKNRIIEILNGWPNENIL